MSLKRQGHSNVIVARLFSRNVIRWFVVCALLAWADMSSMALTADTVYRITFADKGTTEFAPGTELYERTLATFHEDALKRRQLAGMTPLLDSLDKPVDSSYIEQLRVLQVRPLLVLNWSNVVIARLDSDQLNALRQAPYILHVEPVSDLAYRPLSTIDDCTPQRPGTSQTMQDMINTSPLHDAGILGDAVGFGLIDVGFRWQTMTSLRHLEVSATYDFVNNDSIVSNQPGDIAEQDGHGSLVLSVAGGWLQDTLIGIAPTARFVLAKTEDLSHEQRLEEEAYCAAVEWTERQGAWVLSSSVGYFQFDSTEEQADWSVMTGHTTWAAQFLNRAATLGVLPVVAAGNNGPGERTIIIPAEADSAITVGAANSTRAAWLRSSIGPTALGAIKPDLGCLGVQVITQDPDGAIRPVSGTSLAAPQIGGALALLRQLFDDIPSYAIRSALYATCTTVDSVGSRLGHGIPDITQTARRLGEEYAPGIGPPAIIRSPNAVHVYAAVFAAGAHDAKLRVATAMDTITVQGVPIDTLWYSFKVPQAFVHASHVTGQIVAEHERGQRLYPDAHSMFPIPDNGSVIPCGMRLPAGVSEVGDLVTQRERACIVPNPAESGSTIYISGALPVRTMTLVETSTGTVVDILKGVPTTKGWQVSLPELRSGHYLVVIRDGTSSHTIPLIILQ